MDDHSFTEDVSSVGKRKRSLGSSVGTSVPISQGDQPHGALQGQHSPPAQVHPLPKRPRLPAKPPPPNSSIDLLPSALWQLIFSYVDPATLSRLACVNVRFRSLLDSGCHLPREEKFFNVALQPQDAIWRVSRRSFVPTMPRPLADMTERTQFSLTFGSSCQFCGRRSRVKPQSPTSWYISADSNPVRAVWPFKVRACIDCLVPRLRKDADVLLSDASHLRTGLPFALFTSNMLYVPSEAVRTMPIPDGVHLTKYHFIPQINSFSQESREAQALGAAAAEGWLNGLPQTAKDAQNDAARFENWEISGGLSTARSKLFTRVENQLSGNHSEVFARNSMEKNQLVPGPAPTTDQISVPPLVIDLPQMPLHSYGVAPGLEPQYRPPQMYSDATSMDSHRSGRAPKAAPSSRELARIRSRKKHDIVERCRKLVPPISLDMLDRLDAFEAALQIPMPLNDNAWETLKQRLLQQRQKILLQDEARNNVTQAPIPGQFRPPSRTDEHILAHADTPVKQRLCEIAEEYIKQKWGQGGYVTFPTSPHFAADVLIHTRHFYLEHKARIELLEAQRGYVKFASDEEEILTLEHMKWVFEQTIKPRTEQIRKDLFFCRVCTAQGIQKPYAFDSIIQHFASKHTSDFSRGAQVLSWRAKWPDEPPFESHPERMRSPEPSITHTPTLSNIPPSVTSLSTNTHTVIQSVGWKTPDTMSLLSNNTNTLSVVPTTTQQHHAFGGSAPGYSMFHIQRDNLASEIVQGWHMIKETRNIPENLQLYLAINHAIQGFRRRFSNEPSLELFSDCLAKPDLADLRAIENLNCWECVVKHDPNAYANWSLEHLMAHFERSHLEQHVADAGKLKWNVDMIALPEPALVKSLLTVRDLPAPLQRQLLDANIAAITKATDGVKMQIPQNIRRQDDVHMSHEFQVLEPGTRLPDTFRAGAGNPAEVLRYQDRTNNSLAATWGGVNSSRDILSASSGTLKGEPILLDGNGPFREYARAPSRQLIELVPSPQGPRTTSGPNSVLDSRDVDTTHPVPEPMSRSTTFRSTRSQRSLGRSQAPSATEDFLSTIESSLEVEMAESGSNGIHDLAISRVDSRSTSTPGSVTRTNRRTSPSRSLRRRSVTRSRDFYEHGASPRRTGSRGQSPTERHSTMSNLHEPVEIGPVSPATMVRGPSRLIELDNYSTPTQSGSRIHQVSSPPRHNYVPQPMDTYSYTSQRTVSGEYPNYREVRATSMHPMGYHRDRGVPQYVYEPIEQTPAVLHHDRIYDPISGQYFVAERPIVTRYIPIDDPHARSTGGHYDERDRPNEYANNDVNSHISSHRFDDGSGRDPRHDGRYSQGYQR